MRRLAIVATVAFACGVTLGTVALKVLAAEPQKRTSNITQIYKTDLNVCEGKEVVISVIQAGPGRNNWHYHPGDSFTYVMEGTQVRETDEGGAQFEAGTVFHDKPQQIHRSENSGEVKLLVVRVLEKGLPETIPIR